jgi:flagellar hook-associated protein 1 FlgK
MASNIFNIGVSGLNAAQMGLATTQHNIANANTAGYNRQQIVQTANQPQFTGSGYLGQGTNVSSVKRSYDEFLNTQMLQGQAQASQLSTYLTQIKQIDNVLADPAAGLSPAIQDFFNSMNLVGNAADSIPARQTLLSSAQSLMARFQSLNQQFTDMSNSLNGQIGTSVTIVNSFATQLASLNQSITLAQGTSGGQPPNDLLDQRDQLINQLNQEVKATVLKQSDGSYNVFVGNGQPLVVGNQAFALQAVPSLTDPTRSEVAYAANGNTIRLPQTAFQGGKLGGLLSFRDQSLEPARNALGRLAISIASTVNNQHQLGQDLNGALGGNLFNLPAPVVTSASSNAGTAVIAATLSSPNALTTSDYLLQATGVGSYNLIRLSDNTVTALAGLPQTVDGFTVNLSAGAAVVGDRFLIRPTAAGAQNISVAISDPTKIAAAAPIRGNAALSNTGTAAIAGLTVTPPAPVNASLQTPVSITFNAVVAPATLPTYTVTGAVPAVAAPISYTPGTTLNLAYNGWTAQVTGTAKAGDVLTVAPNINGIADNRNALVLANLQLQNTMANSTSNYQGAYAQLVAEVGNKTRETEVNSTAQANMVSQVVQSQQSLAGVNLDEEAANLMRYQRAYQAAGKAIQVANTLFDTLLNLR